MPSGGMGVMISGCLCVCVCDSMDVNTGTVYVELVELISLLLYIFCSL